MAFDTKSPLISYRRLFDNYRDKMKSIVNNLNGSYNFNLSSDDSSYTNFWSVLLDVNILIYMDTKSSFDSMEINSQKLNDTLETRYMDYIGMMMALDDYICFATDAFSRIADSIWSFGDGQVYLTKTGKILPDGSYEIVRKGLQYYYDTILGLFNDMDDYINTDPGPTAPASMRGMSRTKTNDSTYLTWKRENYFIPTAQKISDLLIEVNKEIALLNAYLVTMDKALNKWFIESFKLVSYTNLAFNLSKKAEGAANKIITFNSGVTTTSIIAVNQAKFWKKQILPDMSNRYQCLVSAVEAGLATLSYPGMLESFIDESWELMIPKYGL